MLQAPADVASARFVDGIERVASQWLFTDSRVHVAGGSTQLKLCAVLQLSHKAEYLEVNLHLSIITKGCYSHSCPEPELCYRSSAGPGRSVWCCADSRVQRAPQPPREA
jgi:hypothetical protein